MMMTARVLKLKPTSIAYLPPECVLIVLRSGCRLQVQRQVHPGTTATRDAPVSLSPASKPSPI
jgi:hypothetical protein